MISNGKDSKAVLFNNVSLTVPSLSANKKGHVMKLPEFPAMAPELPPDDKLYAERPVLTEGIVGNGVSSGGIANRVGTVGTGGAIDTHTASNGISGSGTHAVDTQGAGQTTVGTTKFG